MQRSRNPSPSGEGGGQWQVYDSSRGRVVAEVRAEGFAEMKRADYVEVLVPSVLSSFRNFLSNRTVHRILQHSK